MQLHFFVNVSNQFTLTSMFRIGNLLIVVNTHQNLGLTRPLQFTLIDGVADVLPVQAPLADPGAVAGVFAVLEHGTGLQRKII